MPDHAHRCLECNAEEFPADLFAPDRQSEGHVGIRFGDRSGAGVRWEILLDGVDVVANAIEAMTGDDGWVLAYPSVEVKPGVHRRHFGDCKHVCVELRRGHVEVYRIPVSA